MKTKTTLIEKMAEKLKIIPAIEKQEERESFLNDDGNLTHYPPIEKWDDWSEYDASELPKKKKKKYRLVPTVCFNCEAGCGLVAYIDKATNQVRKLEGNPYHPGSRGRNCAKGPATINQINDPERILYPLKRVGKRGEGKWQRVSWDEVLNDVAEKIRKTIKADKKNEVVYHVGRPGHEGFMDNILKAWGVDGHNSHTNICSAGARLGYMLWGGSDRPSPDYGSAKVILLISAHLESGHYFNPHAQRIIEAKNQGAKIIVMDTRLSNTASRADHWLPTYPGTEAAALLAMARVILQEELYNEEYLKNWVNWQAYLKEVHRKKNPQFRDFIASLLHHYRKYTPEYAEKETGIPKAKIIEVARLIAKAKTSFASHNWRSAASGNLGGWQVSRTLHFLTVLTGSVGTKGGTLPNSWNKFHPETFFKTSPFDLWNELHFPNEYPLAHFEMSFLLPHFLKENRGKLSVYFTRVFNPVWTYPDGFSWIEALRDEEKIGLHVALTPTWNETAYYADYVLPMGHSPERHDLVSYETHAGLWIGFRQPVLKVHARKNKAKINFTYEANPGEVWEEDEFWFELSWRIDPDGELGIKKHFLSPYRKNQKVTIDEYYRYIFDRVPGLKEKAKAEKITPLDYMKKYGAFEITREVYRKQEELLSKEELKQSKVDRRTSEIKIKDKVIGVEVAGEKVRGYPTPSRKQEIYSQTMVDWKWGEYALPEYIKSHIHWENMDYEKGDFPLIPTYRLPTLIHSRSANSKWLMEISNRNPLWMHPSDISRLGFHQDELVRVMTEIGYFVIKIWPTEGIRPGTVCCSHHLGRWRRESDPHSNLWGMNTVQIKEQAGKWFLRKTAGISPAKTDDLDSSRIFWEDGGVHQNITFPVHPDPISGMHCWHQKVRVVKAEKGDRYGDIMVDTKKSMGVYKKWLKKTRPAPGPKNLRRPLWFKRPLRPLEKSFYLK